MASLTALTHVDADAPEASAWLVSVARQGADRAAADAILPLLLAGASDLWPTLAGIARDAPRASIVRHTAARWLAAAVNRRLGLEDSSTVASDDQVQEQAVFALSQRPQREGLSALLDIAKRSPHRAARRAAIVCLGQAADGRAIDLFEAFLRHPGGMDRDR